MATLTNRNGWYVGDFQKTGIYQATCIEHDLKHGIVKLVINNKIYKGVTARSFFTRKEDAINAAYRLVDDLKLQSDRVAEQIEEMTSDNAQKET